MIINKQKISEFDPVEGAVLLIDKPLGKTSFDVVAIIRRVVSKAIGSKLKVGHAGTLDPLATGLLILCTGKMTKQIDQYQAQKKTYTGSFFLGATRPSYDCETEIDAHYAIDHIGEKELEQTRQNFLGEIYIPPPAHSAVKINGKPAYKMARKGQELELKPRQMIIEEFELYTKNKPVLEFKIVCSKGTYIRSIAHEYGKKLNNGAYLNSLCRTQIGEFSLADAWNLDEFVDLFQKLPSNPLHQ